MTLNPSGSGAYLQGVGSAVVGQQLTTAMTMTVPSSTSMQGARAIWEVIDMDGFVWSSGDCGTVESNISPVNPSTMQVTADATIVLPSNMVANPNGSRYQVRYTLAVNGNNMMAFEQFIVMPPVSSVLGPIDMVEVMASEIKAKLVLPQQAGNVACAIWNGNGPMTPPKAAGEFIETQGGLLYKVPFKPGGHPSRLVSIEPYNLMWTWLDSDENENTARADLFFVNPLMLDCVREIQTFINRAYVDSGISPGTTFSTTDCLRALRYARDQFNATDKTTNFSMINAQGQFRHFWISYACVYAARAQYLAEGMKTFDYGGQNITLNVDRTQYWESIASTVEAQMNDQIRNFKTQLARRGNFQGDGSYTGLVSAGHVGITIHAASPFRVSLWSPVGAYNSPNLWV